MTDVDQLVARSAADPHSFLGAHPDGNGGVIIRAFRPEARAVHAITADGRAELAPVHDGGLFEGTLEGDAPPAYCRSRDVSQDTDRVFEREANIFGAELLMPEAAVRDAWAAVPDATYISSRFDVSALAAQWRLFSFGLAERPG